MNIQYIQHVPFETPGQILVWAEEHGHSVTGSRVYAGEALGLPALEALDWLVVMGGPMSVGDEKAHPWLTVEKRFIEAALKKNKTILGICLGAQLLASVLGANVFRNRHREIGWFDVKLNRDAATFPVTRGLPRKFCPLHWHGETFDIPRGAVNIAESKACTNQAFVYGGRAVGLQFHLEMTERGVSDLVENCRNEIETAPYIQKPETIKANISRLRTTHTILDSLLDRFEVETILDVEKN
jgi:GMP synthase-like glutamine amidotransferase